MKTKKAIAPVENIAASQDSILDPLWDLMLSTNDCYPGCSCERDFFDMTPWRVQLWTKNAGEGEKQNALQQLEKLISSASFDLEKMTYQVNYCFADRAEVIAWLIEWKVLLNKTQ